MVGAVGTPAGGAEDLIAAERRSNKRNTSLIFRYRIVYLIYRSSTVRKFLTTLYVRGGGGFVQYFGGGDGECDGGSNALFSSGSVTGVGIRDEDEGEIWHFSRRC